MPPPAPARRLADSSSAYLRSAAGQDIEWYPWGDEAFRIAKESGRPILLDIGAAWCHWCHVMDEGTYSDREVARLIGQGFVAVKVDRDENPEVDRRYQQQVNALTGEGGWPLTAFLTPQGETFLGGTYFPPDDGMGRPGFRRVLQEVSRLWREERSALKDQARAVAEGLKTSHEHGAHAEGEVALPAFIERTAAKSLERFDPAHGGFGGAPKFPHPTAISLLLALTARSGEERGAQAARTTLLRMADGGMYDQLGGGFHRYSVDEAWRIPHFEKMALDNAQLLTSYVEGWCAFGDERFREVIEGTVGWVQGTLGRDGKGGFAASQDADNAPGDDGGYFTWSSAQLRALLSPEEFRVVRWRFGLDGEARMREDPMQNVLQRFFSLAEVADHLKAKPEEVAKSLESALEKMRIERSRRPEPTVDGALYASLNGMLIGAFAQASVVLNDPRPLASARRAADRFLWEGFDPTRGIAHRLSPQGGEGYGLLEDQSQFALGLLHLAEATGEGRYLQAARTILDVTLREFAHPPDGLLRDLAPRIYDGPKVGAWEAPSLPLEDTPHLSANAAMVLALDRWAALTGREGPDPQAAALLAQISKRLLNAGLYAAGSALAATVHLQPAVRVVIEGKGAEADALFLAAARTYHPRKVLFRGAPRPPFVLPEEAIAAASGGGKVRALVCRGTSCLPPITEGKELARVLRTEAASGSSES
jgi:uncharacterized protein